MRPYFPAVGGVVESSTAKVRRTYSLVVPLIGGESGSREWVVSKDCTVIQASRVVTLRNGQSWSPEGASQVYRYREGARSTLATLPRFELVPIDEVRDGVISSSAKDLKVGDQIQLSAGVSANDSAPPLFGGEPTAFACLFLVVEESAGVVTEPDPDPVADVVTLTDNSTIILSDGSTVTTEAA